MKKKSANRGKRLSSDSLLRHLAKSFLGAVILTGIVIAGGLVVVCLLDIRPAHTPLRPSSGSEGDRGPVFEIYPDHDTPASTSGGHRFVPGEKPRVAIIIDDLGYDARLAEQFLSCGIPLTFSILPHSPANKIIARAAHEKGWEVMLHLPMEPTEYPAVNPGPGVLLTSMSPDELLRKLENNLADVPYVAGVNNHMGSRMTKVSTQLYQIFSVLKKNGFFFVDSRTTSETLCRPSARLLQVPFAERDIFLDNVPGPDYIAHQLEQLVELARQKGGAIGIAHPHAVTARVLKEKLPAMKKTVVFVPVSEMVHIVDS